MEAFGGYFTRIGSSKRELSPEMLARLFQRKSQTRIVCFDEQVVAGATMDALSPLLFRRFRTPLSDADDLSFLKKLHFAAADVDGVLRPTVGGLLMACDHPERWLPSAFIQAVAYRGTDRTADQQLDARDLTGALDRQVLDAVKFVDRNMRVFAVKKTGRMDIPQFSLSAVFEALVNAVAHRDYSIYGSKIRLHLFSDRIEIFSPGGLPNSLTLDEISQRQFTRNELICSVMSRCEITENIQNIRRTTMMDRRGEGVPIIVEESEKLSGKKPKYRILDDSELMLTIFSAPGDDEQELHRIAASLTESETRNTEKITDRTEKMLSLMRQNGTITQQELALSIGVSRSWVAAGLVRLKKSGRVRRVGPDKGGHWEVVR